MSKLARPEVDQAELRRARILWVADNNGLLKRIAEKIGVSPPFVTDVLYGRRKSRDNRVEALLAEAGAPGFEMQTAS